MILSTMRVHAVTSDVPAMSGGMSTIKMDNSAPVSAASATAYLTGASLHTCSPVTIIMRLYITLSSNQGPCQSFTMVLLQGTCHGLLRKPAELLWFDKTRGRVREK